jgi:hypothetical protein
MKVCEKKKEYKIIIKFVFYFFKQYLSYGWTNFLCTEDPTHLLGTEKMHNTPNTQ